MQIEMLSIDKIQPYEDNPRIHTDQHVQEIVGSIKRFGFKDPIAIDEKDNSIIEGHGRYYAAKVLGMEEIPVIKLGHLDDIQRSAYRIAHNKLTESTGFDLAVLIDELDDITSGGIGSEVLGFSNEDLQEIQQKMAEDGVVEKDVFDHKKSDLTDEKKHLSFKCTEDERIALVKSLQDIGLSMGQENLGKVIVHMCKWYMEKNYVAEE